MEVKKPVEHGGESTKNSRQAFHAPGCDGWDGNARPRWMTAQPGG
jgi:hypothetical protein